MSFEAATKQIATQGGTAKIIEEIRKDLRKDVKPAREGARNRAVKEGSEKIGVIYRLEIFLWQGMLIHSSFPLI